MVKTPQPLWRTTKHLLTGEGIAQVFPILILPVLSRFYPPEEFARAAMVITSAQLLAMLGTFQLHQAIMLPKDNATARSILQFSWSTLLLIVVLSFAATGILYWFSFPMHPLWLCVPPMALLSGLGQLFHFSQLREAETRRIRNARLAQGFSQGITRIVLGIMQTGWIGLAGGNMVGLVWQIAILGHKMFTRLRFRMRRDIIAPYRAYLLYSTPGYFLHTLAGQAPLYVFAVWFGEADGGAFAMALRLLILPVGILSGVLGQTFYQRIALDPQQAYSAMKTLIRPVILLTGFGAPLAYYHAGEVVPWILGQEWQTAGIMVEWLIWPVALQLVTSPFSYFFDVKMKQRLSFLLNMATGVLRISSLLIAFYLFRLNLIECMQVFCVVASLIWLFYLGLFTWWSGRPWHYFFPRLLGICGGTLLLLWFVQKLMA